MISGSKGIGMIHSIFNVEHGTTALLNKEREEI